MKSNRARTLLAGAASMVLIFCSVSAQAYDPEFDYNADGVVDSTDMEMITAAFNTGEGDSDYDPIFDHDGDGMVGGDDIVRAQIALNGE